MVVCQHPLSNTSLHAMDVKENVIAILGYSIFYLYKHPPPVIPPAPKLLPTPCCELMGGAHTSSKCCCAEI